MLKNCFSAQIGHYTQNFRSVFEQLRKQNVLLALYLLYILAMKYLSHLLLTFSLLALYACSTPSTSEKMALKSGVWRAVLKSQGGELPFGLEVVPNADSSTFTVYALNGEERLKMDTATITNDSVRIPMDLFDSEIVAKVGDSTLIGTYTKRGIKTLTQMPFQATYGKSFRFSQGEEPIAADISGKWSVTFVSGDGKDTTQSVGVFTQQNHQLSGSFLTTTGDYRYLAGNVKGDTAYLSCFDGMHVYLFKSKIDAATHTMNGEFWSGTTGYEKWTATKNDQAQLPDANSLTFLKPGYEQLDFTFPDVTGKPVSIKDEKYKGKVVIVQLMGSWCPNCMDETNFLSPWYKKNKGRGIEIIGLAYERKPGLEVNIPKLKKLIERHDINYQVLFAGTSDKAAAAATLPALNSLLAFPTTIFIDKKGIVRRIHTGFSGPGTGKYYTEFVEDFELFIDKLVKESPGV